MSEPKVVQEPDRTPVIRIVIVFILWSAVVAGAILIVPAFETEHGRQEKRTPAPSSSLLFGVHQGGFGRAAAGLDLWQRQRRGLERWEIVDEQRGIARIPIEVAMKVIATRSAVAEKEEQP